MNKYSDAYVLTGNAVHILATSLASIKGRVTGALREIRRLKAEELPDREAVKYTYNKLAPYMTGDLYETFYGKRSTKLQEIANTIYELHSQITLDYHLPDGS